MQLTLLRFAKWAKANRDQILAIDRICMRYDIDPYDYLFDPYRLDYALIVAGPGLEIENKQAEELKRKSKRRR